MSAIGEIVGGVAGMVLWKKAGDQLRIQELENGCTLLESDTPPQVLNVSHYAEGWPVFKSYDLAHEFERETQKHLPEGYHVHMSRVENHHGYSLNVWRLEPGTVQGEDEAVIHLDLGFDALMYWLRGDWRLELVNHLQRNFDERQRKDNGRGS